MLNRRKNIDQWGPIDGRPLYASFWFVFAMQEMKDRWGIYWPDLEGVFAAEKMTFWWDSDEIKKMGKKVIEKYLLAPKKLSSLKSEYKKSIDALNKSAAQVKELPPDSDFKRVQLLAAEWFAAFNNFWLIAAVPEIANYGSPTYLENLLEPYIADPNQRAEALRILLAPEHLSFHQKSELELLKLFLNNPPNKLRSKLEAYTARWFWVENSYYESKYLNASYFLRQLRGVKLDEAAKRVQRIENYRREVKKTKRKILKAHHLPVKILKTASLLSYSIWWQDHRKSIIWWANSIIDDLSARACKEFGLSHNHIMFYLYDEWLRLFVDKKTLPDHSLKVREKKFGVVIGLKGYKTYLGKQADTLVRKFAVSGKDGVDVLHGLTVSHGPIARGRVRILPSTRDISKFKKGEILIAPMTSPDYVPVMRKAKAVVTDVGGLMSHAAVVSRELGIPCIVGTKVATKAFKDGDIVEVDANRGIVKLVKRG